MTEAQPQQVVADTLPPPHAPPPASEAQGTPATVQPSVIPVEESQFQTTVVEKIPESATEKKAVVERKGSADRDVQLAQLETEKNMSLIKAWEESERSKVENKAHKKATAVEAWENSKKASVEAELRKYEEKLEKQKAEYAEKMKNKVAMIHKEAEEKKANIEAKRGEDVLKVEEMAAKYRATGKPPKKLFWSVLKM